MAYNENNNSGAGVISTTYSNFMTLKAAGTLQTSWYEITDALGGYTRVRLFAEYGNVNDSGGFGFFVNPNFGSIGNNISADPAYGGVFGQTGVNPVIQRGVWRNYITELFTIDYTNLIGGIFAVGDTIIDGTTGASAIIVQDNGSSQLQCYYTSTGLIFGGGNTFDNGAGVFADVVSISTPIAATGDIIIWNRDHYQIIDDTSFNGNAPDINSTAYQQLVLGNNAPANLGGVNVMDRVIFDTDNNLLVLREDANHNTVCEQNNIHDFQWGNPLIKDCEIDFTSDVALYNSLNGQTITLKIKSNSFADFTMNDQAAEIHAELDSFIDASHNKGGLGNIKLSSSIMDVSQNTSDIVEVDMFDGFIDASHNKAPIADVYIKNGIADLSHNTMPVSDIQISLNGILDGSTNGAVISEISIRDGAIVTDGTIDAVLSNLYSDSGVLDFTDCVNFVGSNMQVNNGSVAIFPRSNGVCDSFVLTNGSAADLQDGTGGVCINLTLNSSAFSAQRNNAVFEDIQVDTNSTASMNDNDGVFTTITVSNNSLFQSATNTGVWTAVNLNSNCTITGNNFGGVFDSTILDSHGQMDISFGTGVFSGARLDTNATIIFKTPFVGVISGIRVSGFGLELPGANVFNGNLSEHEKNTFDITLDITGLGVNNGGPGILSMATWTGGTTNGFGEIWPTGSGGGVVEAVLNYTNQTPGSSLFTGTITANNGATGTVVTDNGTGIINFVDLNTGDWTAAANFTDGSETADIVSAILNFQVGELVEEQMSLQQWPVFKNGMIVDFTGQAPGSNPFTGILTADSGATGTVIFSNSTGSGQVSFTDFNTGDWYTATTITDGTETANINYVTPMTFIYQPSGAAVGGTDILGLTTGVKYTNNSMSSVSIGATAGSTITGDDSGASGTVVFNISNVVAMTGVSGSFTPIEFATINGSTAQKTVIVTANTFTPQNFSGVVYLTTLNGSEELIGVENLPLNWPVNFRSAVFDGTTTFQFDSTAVGGATTPDIVLEGNSNVTLTSYPNNIFDELILRGKGGSNIASQVGGAIY